MAQPYVGEIRMFAGNFAPTGWLFCHGQLLSIAENEVLFQLIGTTYGGDGQSTFAVPDLRGRFPLHQGASGGTSNRTLGESGGEPTVTLTPQTIPAHNHVLLAASMLGYLNEPNGTVPAAHRDLNAYDATPMVVMDTRTISVAGGSQPHENMPPYLGLSFIISLFGIFPSQV